MQPRAQRGKESPGRSAARGGWRPPPPAVFPAAPASCPAPRRHHQPWTQARLSGPARALRCHIRVPTPRAVWAVQAEPGHLRPRPQPHVTLRSGRAGHEEGPCLPPGGSNRVSVGTRPRAGQSRGGGASARRWRGCQRGASSPEDKHPCLSHAPALPSPPRECDRGGWRPRCHRRLKGRGKQPSAHSGSLGPGRPAGPTQLRELPPP